MICSSRCVRAVAVATTAMLSGNVFAAEGASSNYFPGTYATFGVALTPDPGLTFVNQALFYSADANRAVLEGRVELGIDAVAFYDLLTLLYAFEKPVLGGRLAVGGWVPFGYQSIEASVTGMMGSIRVDESRFSIGDIGIIPASMYWSKGDLHFNLYEVVFAPTGQYNADNSANIGRNYWSFDTIFAATYFNSKTATEVSLVNGIMANTKNDDTDYRTGAEYHLDLAVNQFLSESFAVGLHGYYYKQFTGDSGSGAVLGDFKGESVGLGPALLWSPKRFDGDLSVVLKWLHDLDTTNRLDGDYVNFTVGWKF